MEGFFEVHGQESQTSLTATELSVDVHSEEKSGNEAEDAEEAPGTDCPEDAEEELGTDDESVHVECHVESEEEAHEVEEASDAEAADDQVTLDYKPYDDVHGSAADQADTCPPDSLFDSDDEKIKSSGAYQAGFFSLLTSEFDLMHILRNFGQDQAKVGKAAKAVPMPDQQAHLEEQAEKLSQKLAAELPNESILKAWLIF